MVIAEFTLDAFPISEKLRKGCGLPFGFTLQPFARVPHLVDATNVKDSAATIARCRDCYSYINAYCMVDEQGFSCSLCGSYNLLSAAQQSRYNSSMPLNTPELCSNVVLVKCEDPALDDEDETENLEWQPPEGVPVYIALVDTMCSDEFLDCVRTALTAALDALPPGAMFGLITFDGKVQLYDMQGSVPSRRSLAVLSDGPLLAELENVMPLQRLLAPVGSCKESILLSLEAMQPANRTVAPTRVAAPNTVHPFTAQENQSEIQGQCFGTAIEGVLQYLQPLSATVQQDPSQIMSKGRNARVVRVLSFLNSLPSLGHGSLTSYMLSSEFLKSRQNTTADQPQRQNAELSTTMELELGVPLSSQDNYNPALEAYRSAVSLATSFYNQAALVAASMGVTIDLFGVSNDSLGLEVLAALAEYTGGGIWRYPSVSDEMLTQDLHRLLSTTHAHACLLRIRTSPEFKIANYYGKLFKDPEYDDVYHIVNCDPFETVAFDFQYSRGSFDPDTMPPPVLQIAFQYSVSIYDSSGCLHQERHMRICTLEGKVAHTPREVYEGIRSSAVVSLLLHKSKTAILSEGHLRAGLLLQDWMVILAAHYIQNRCREENGGVHQELEDVRRVKFDGFVALQMIPRLVYGLLRSNLLLGGCASRAPEDEKVYKLHLWTGLPPSHLQRSVYPSLASYLTPDEEDLPLHSLSNNAVSTSNAPIFLLDAYASVLVFFKANSSCEGPLPVTSLLRSVVNEMRHNRRLVPQYKVLREGEPNEVMFKSLMTDEPFEPGLKLEGEAASPFFGYKAYLEWVHEAAMKLLSSVGLDE